MIENMLVPVDGSANANEALEFACELATRFEAAVSIVHVVEWAPGQKTLVLGAARTTIPATPESVEKAGRPVLDEAVALAERCGVRIAHAEVRSGVPARRLLDAAADFGTDTIVMGSRGLGGVSGLLLGSVSDKVSRDAPCTCVVVR